MFCGYCGCRMTDDMRFCPQCGMRAVRGGAAPFAGARPQRWADEPSRPSATVSTGRAKKKSLVPFLAIAIAAALAIVAIVAFVGPENIRYGVPENDLTIHRLPEEDDDADSTLESDEDTQTADDSQGEEGEENPL